MMPPMMFFSHSHDDSKFCTNQRSAGLEADFCIMLNLGVLFAWSKRGGRKWLRNPKDPGMS